MFSNANKYISNGEVLVPWWVEDTVGGCEYPLIADQTSPTQQLLGAPLVQHHLP